MVNFDGFHVGSVTGKRYTFAGTAEFRDPHVHWQADFTLDGAQLGQHNSVIGDVEIGSLTVDAAKQGAERYIEEKFER